MPPTILNDAVQQVVDKLSRLNGGHNIHRIPEPLLDRAREQVRILQTRVALGKLGRHDRPERRAAIVLEYVVRQSQSSSSNSGGSGSGSTSAAGSISTGTAPVTRLSMPDLAKAVGIKLTHLQELHKMVGNYLQPAQQQQRQRQINRPATSRLQSSIPASRLVGRGAPGATTTDEDTTIAAPNSQLEKSRRLRSTMTQSASASSNASSANANHSNSRIPDLAIRLAAFVVDPHGFGRQAELLLAAIERHISSAQTAVHERRGNLYDLQRYRTAYEAACFYHVVTTRGQQQQPGGGGGAAVSKVSARRKSDKHNHEDHNNINADDGDDAKHQRPLQVADLVEASNDFTYLELKQVLPNVVQLAGRIEQEKVQQQKLQKEKQQQSQSTSSRNSTKKSATTMTAASKRKQAPDSNATSTTTSAAKKQAMIKEMTRQKDDHFHAEYDNNRYDDSGMILEESVVDTDVVTFAEWKEQMLSQAIHQAKQDIRIETSATATSTTTTVDGNDDVDASKDIAIDDDDNDDDNTIAYDTALERAADTVLLKYGLLSLPVFAAS
jgi:hypothetical protein